MTSDERRLFNAKVGELLHTALVVIRSATYPPTPDDDRPTREELNDLADLLHNMPRYVVGHDEYAVDTAGQFRAAVVDHVRRFYPDTPAERHRYVELLDMDAGTFLARYRDHNWDSPEPEPAGQTN